MRAGADTTGTPVDAHAHIASSGPLLDDGQFLAVNQLIHFASFIGFGIDLRFGKTVHVDIAVGAILRAQTTTDTVVFDFNLKRVTVSVNRIYRTAHHAIGVQARATTTGDQKTIKPHTFAD